MRRFILTATLVIGFMAAASVPGTANAQYGFYGNYGGGGGRHCGHSHVRSLAPPGYFYQQTYRPYGGYGYGGGYGSGYRGYGPGYGYNPYGGYGGGYGGGHSHGGITIRW